MFAKNALAECAELLNTAADGRTARSVGRTDGSVGRTNGRTDGQTDDERTNRRTDGRTDILEAKTFVKELAGT